MSSEELVLNIGEKVIYYSKTKHLACLRVGYVIGFTPKFIKIKSALGAEGLMSNYVEYVAFLLVKRCR